jgi:hypothetical protein
MLLLRLSWSTTSSASIASARAIPSSWHSWHSWPAIDSEIGSRVVDHRARTHERDRRERRGRSQLSQKVRVLGKDRGCRARSDSHRIQGFVGFARVVVWPARQCSCRRRSDDARRSLTAPCKQSLAVLRTLGLVGPGDVSRRRHQRMQPSNVVPAIVASAGRNGARSHSRTSFLPMDSDDLRR